MRSWTSRLYKDPILMWYDYESVGRRNGVRGCFVWKEMNIDSSTQELFNRKFLDCLSLMLEEDHISKEDVVRILKGYPEQKEERPGAEERKKEKFSDPVDGLEWTPKVKKALDVSIKKVDKLNEKKNLEKFTDPVDGIEWTPGEEDNSEEEDTEEVCPDCGELVQEEDTKCSKCGFIFEEEDTEEEKKEKFSDPVDDLDWTPE